MKTGSPLLLSQLQNEESDEALEDDDFYGEEHSRYLTAADPRYVAPHSVASKQKDVMNLSYNNY